MTQKYHNPATTTDLVAPGNFGPQPLPEFGRQPDVQRLFGLKRGTCYNLLNDGKIRGVLLRVRGRKSGVRLFDLNSIEKFIRSEMEAQNGGTATEDAI